MTRDLILPPSMDVDSNFAVLAAPLSAVTTWPPKFSDVDAETAVDVTYSLTTDGFTHGKSQDTTTDPRFSLREILGGFGPVTHTFSLTWVYGNDEEDIADNLFHEGEQYVIFVRYATPWEQELAATDKWDVLTVEAGTKVRNTAAGAKFTRTVAFAPRRRVLEDVVLAP